MPDRFAQNPSHAHNRLLSSVVLDAQQRRAMARAMMDKLAKAKGDTAFLLPLNGGNEWDREGGPLHDAKALAAFVDEVRQACPASVRLVEIAGHINDPVFTETALAVVDGWIAQGLLSAG